MNNTIHSKNFAVHLFAAALLLASASSALADLRYVDVNSTNAAPPYISWSTAAMNIQDAIDAAVAGDEIVVTNGIFSIGGRSTLGQSTTTNRVVVDKPLALRSVNGPQSTIIDGGGVFRCVYLTNGASLSGFTFTNGVAGAGGGVFCASQTVVVSNCVVSGNAAHGFGLYDAHGGGAFWGTLNNCTLADNWADDGGGGASGSILNNCMLTGNSADSGGAAEDSTLNNCALTHNFARFFWIRANNFIYPSGTGYGGGASGCALNNCTLSGNSAAFGGGAFGCALVNCTLTGNSVSVAHGSYYDRECACTINVQYGGSGGGAYDSTLKNCVTHFNELGNYSSCTLNYSCTTPLPTNGVGNITNAPLFVDQASGNLRLQSNSPCINAGLNAFALAGPDLDGNLRIVGGSVDMGAYEFQSPTSIAPQLTITASGTNVIVAWPTNYAEVVHDQAYFLYSTTNLLSPVVWRFVYPMPVVVNGQLVVTNTIDGIQRFYRIAKVTVSPEDLPCLWSGPNPCPCAVHCIVPAGSSFGIWAYYATCRSCAGEF